MSEDAQAVVTLLVVLIMFGLFLTPFVLFFAYVFYQTFKRKRIRERMLQTHGQVIGNNPTVPVRYSSESKFKAWLKIFPWEGTGLLVPVHGNVRFFGEYLNGIPVNL